MGRVRSRVRLISVGVGAGVITLATTIGVSTLAGQTFGSTGLEFWDQLLERDAADVNYLTNLLQGAGWYGICVVLAGFFMTGLLPIIVWIFGVQTDISLLELGDPAHPLLQELKNRAPGTFTHSLNVGMLSEPAADAIGAMDYCVESVRIFMTSERCLSRSTLLKTRKTAMNNSYLR